MQRLSPAWSVDADSPAARWLLSGGAADGFKIIPERLYAVCANDLPDLILELRHEFLSDRKHLKAAFGGLYELCSPVGRIGHTYDVTVGLEVLDQFSHGLLGHLRAFGQNADRGTGVVQVLKDRSVRRAYRAMAALGQPDDDEVVERDEITVLATSAQTNGDLFAVEVRMPPGGGPPQVT